MNDWKEISHGFGINEEYIWLNSAGISVPHEKIVKEVKNAIDEYSSYGYLTPRYEYEEIKDNIRTILAELLMVSKKEIALIHNTAEGMNFLSHGFTFKAGSEVIILKDEYPSNAYPWLYLRKQGVIVKQIPYVYDEDRFIREFEKTLSEKTRLVSFSAVHWLTGRPVPLKRVGDICKKNDIVFAVDGAQGLGHIPVYPQKMNISYMCGSAWKWLLGPVGLAYLYISEDFLENVEYRFWGTDSVENSQNYLPYKDKLKPDTDRFSYSSSSFLDYVFFHSALNLMKEIGFSDVQNRIYELAAMLRKYLTEASYSVLEMPSEVKSGIVLLKVAKDKASQIHQKLERKKIICALRGEGIRFSPHIMNTEQQILEVIENL